MTSSPSSLSTTVAIMPVLTCTERCVLWAHTHTHRSRHSYRVAGCRWYTLSNLHGTTQRECLLRVHFHIQNVIEWAVFSSLSGSSSHANRASNKFSPLSYTRTPVRHTLSARRRPALCSFGRITHKFYSIFMSLFRGRSVCVGHAAHRTASRAS